VEQQEDLDGFLAGELPDLGPLAVAAVIILIASGIALLEDRGRTVGIDDTWAVFKPIIGLLCRPTLSLSALTSGFRPVAAACHVDHPHGAARVAIRPGKFRFVL
jgi:hypothetical protein